MTYGCEILKLTKQTKNSLRIAQRAMEKVMLGISLRDKNNLAKNSTKQAVIEGVGKGLHLAMDLQGLYEETQKQL